MGSKEAKYIEIRGARVHNLKNVSVQIPRNSLTVVTGLSGSGKTSLAFDTLFADGQRRYVESLSSYARQFLGRMSKPEVDFIDGVSPAIAIEQKVNTRNPRSTVGTSTEIYDYLKLLFTRIGRTYSPISGDIVKRYSVSDIVDFCNTFNISDRFVVAAPIQPNGRSIEEQMEMYLKQGFARLINEKGSFIKLSDLSKDKPVQSKENLFLVIDRLQITEDDSWKSRVADSVQTAFYEGQGYCNIFYQKDKVWNHKEFSNKFELDGIRFEEPSVNFFTFNNPLGACKNCEGYGSVIGIDPDLVIPDKYKSVYEGAIAPWSGEKLSAWKDNFILNAHHFDFPIHKPFNELSPKQQELLWNGNEYFDGIHAFFREVENNSYKIQYRVLLSRYRGKTSCPECNGSRLRKDANYVKILGKSITDIVSMSIKEALEFFNNVQLEGNDLKIASRILEEIHSRLKVLDLVGLSYLTLNRMSNSLSGGESQRINLATSLASSLVGSMYILDEPSIGLHPRDTDRLIEVLKNLRDIGNTVIVVEHDEDIMQAADYIIDMGPEAGAFGGELVYQGDYQGLLSNSDGLTAKYLRNELQIEVPKIRRKWKYQFQLLGASLNNLKNIDVEFPIGVITVVTGVSGSGKTSLVKGVLFPAFRNKLGEYSDIKGKYQDLVGDYQLIKEIHMIDQNPIGRSSRSNPVTYIKAFDEIRSLFAAQKLAKLRNYKPGYFSFNVPGGRCEMCQGDGLIKVEMQFMADIYLNCEHCQGRRFKNETLEIKYRGKSIADILEMSVVEALAFFNSKDKNRLEEKIYEKIKILDDVGLGYIKLGQPSNTLSGGEAQRIKLAFFLTKGNTASKALFIFDEPTTGLHFQDIKKLYASINALIKFGHSVIIIEHNQEVIKCADWVIDMGPDGGDAGGEVVFAGTPEDLLKSKDSLTAKYLKASKKI